MLMYLDVGLCRPSVDLNLRKLLRAHKSYVRETSLYSSALYHIKSAIAKHLASFRCHRARSKSGQVKPRRQRGPTAAICDDGGRVVVRIGVESGHDISMRVRSSVVSRM